MSISYTQPLVTRLQCNTKQFKIALFKQDSYRQGYINFYIFNLLEAKLTQNGEFYSFSRLRNPGNNENNSIVSNIRYL